MDGSDWNGQAPACESRNALPLQELEAQITELAGQLNAANYRLLSLIAEFDRRQGWSDGSTPSCAHWLSWKCGIDLGAAREKVRVGHALEKLPKIAGAMRRGESMDHGLAVQVLLQQARARPHGCKSA